jgi:murein DD-endopeptidase MepM/ murein hydrolase activator NlpD
VSSLEVLLLNDSLADFMSEVKYLEDINHGIEKNLRELESLKNELQQEKVNLSNEREQLAKLEDELKSRQEKLQAEKDNKFYLLEQVSQSEREYKRLLAQAKQEQEAAAADIATMEKIVRAKLAKLDGEELKLNENGLIWPVKKNVVTAYFHDPEYPFRHIFEHPAIDIRAGHGSVLRAAASGYVARVKRGLDGSYGYIMIVHGDGLSTVYGHVSQVDVKEDEFVVQGQKIGNTGGLPGTAGAGRLTTGPHLHFEVRLNGIPVDPLGYLP